MEGVADPRKVRVEYTSERTMHDRETEVNAAMVKLDGIFLELGGWTPNGGYRVQVREIISAVFDSGYVARSWEPADAGAGSPRTTSEATGRPRVAGHAHEREEKATEARGEDTVAALRGWWEQTAYDEVAQLTAKMVEYGGLTRATDLTEIGRDLVAAGVSKGPLTGAGNVQDGWLQELGIYFYVRGKFARWQAAIIEGRPVSGDTLLDIAVYTRMAQRVRAVGGWPV